MKMNVISTEVQNKHKLFDADFYDRQMPWETIGHKVNRTYKVTTAFKKAGLDYEVRLEDAAVRLPDNFGKPEWLGIPNRQQIVRYPTNWDDTFRFFGEVTPRYEILDNMILADYIDWLISDSDWKVDTVGHLDNGQTVWVLIDMGKFTLSNGEELDNFLSFRDVKNGRTRAVARIYTGRPFCTNVFAYGKKHGNINLEFIHRDGLHDQIDFRIKFMESVRKQLTGTQENLNSLLGHAMTDDEVVVVLNKVYKEPKRSARAALTDNYTKADVPEELHTYFESAERAQSTHEFFINRTERLRDGAMELYNLFGIEYPGEADTAYALFNAVAESADHRRGKTPEVVSESSLFGTRAKEKELAFAELLKIS
jgi:hypothetical protein